MESWILLFIYSYTITAFARNYGNSVHPSSSLSQPPNLSSSFLVFWFLRICWVMTSLFILKTILYLVKILFNCSFKVPSGTHIHIPSGPYSSRQYHSFFTKTNIDEIRVVFFVPQVHQHQARKYFPNPFNILYRWTRSSFERRFSSSSSSFIFYMGGFSATLAKRAHLDLWPIPFFYHFNTTQIHSLAQHTSKNK